MLCFVKEKPCCGSAEHDLESTSPADLKIDDAVQAKQNRKA
jgi:hypothetical protein